MSEEADYSRKRRYEEESEVNLEDSEYHHHEGQNPNPNPNPYHDVSHTTTTDSHSSNQTGTGLKRSRLEGDSDVKSFEIRTLISSLDVGCIIGKGGATISKIREECGCIITILKARSPNAPREAQRVMQVRGGLPKVIAGLQSIVSLLARAEEAKEAKGLPPSNPNARGLLTFRLLIHQNLAGALLGKGGSFIKECREQTKCRISISPEPLPGSTEKSVDITGTPEQIGSYLETALNKLAEAPPLRVGTRSILFDPEAMFESVPMPSYASHPHAPSSSYGRPPREMKDSYGGHGYSAPSSRDYRSVPPPDQHRGLPPRDRRDPYRPPSEPMYDPYAPSPYASAPLPPVAAPASVPMSVPAGMPTTPIDMGAPSIRQEVAIPTTHVGAVIGARGAMIESIKRQSGCMINIAREENGNPGERIATITGPQQCVAVAINLIRSAVQSGSGAPLPEVVQAPRISMW